MLDVMIVFLFAFLGYAGFQTCSDDDVKESSWSGAVVGGWAARGRDEEACLRNS